MGERILKEASARYSSTLRLVEVTTRVGTAQKAETSIHLRRISQTGSETGLFTGTREEFESIFGPLPET